METFDPGADVPKIQSLERGVAVIRCFDADHPRMTLAEVSKRTNLSRATVRRFLYTLVSLGYVETDGREFALRARILELGYSYLSSSQLPEIARPHLRDLTDLVHESSSVSVLEGQDIVYVARVPFKRIMTVSINVGTRFPAYSTSMGRAMLAGLPESDLEQWLDSVTLDQLTELTITDRAALERELDAVRERGWALVDQELEIGLRSIAVPIKNAHGATIAAANISASAHQGTVDDIVDNLLPPLQAAVQAIEFDLAHTHA